MSAKCWIPCHQASLPPKNVRNKQNLSETTLPEIWKQAKVYSNTADVDSRKKQLNIAGNLVEFPFALPRRSWGGSLEGSTHVPGEGPWSVCKGSTASPAHDYCVGLCRIPGVPVSAQSGPELTHRGWKVVGTASEQCRAGRMTAKEGRDHQVWGEGPERRVVVIVLFWKPG